MNKALRSIRTAIVCFLLIILLDFLLPRMLPGDPVAYLSGFAEDELSSQQYEYYRTALHLNETPIKQFVFYIRSLLDGTLGYSFQKESTVSALIGERIGNTFRITIPAVILSTVVGLFWGLNCAWRRGSVGDRISSSALIVLNAAPTFVIALVLVAVFCFKNRWFPYTGISSENVVPGTASYFADRIYHLVLPVLTLTVATLPSRFLLMRNTAGKVMDEKYVLYAKQRGLPPGKIKMSYILPNIAQPFITMVGMSVSVCVGGSLVIENIFSIPGMGRLLNEAVYSLDYPLMQGILFVTTLIMVSAVIITDIICILIDPKLRAGGGK